MLLNKVFREKSLKSKVKHKKVVIIRLSYTNEQHCSKKKKKKTSRLNYYSDFIAPIFLSDLPNFWPVRPISYGRSVAKRLRSESRLISHDENDKWHMSYARNKINDESGCELRVVQLLYLLIYFTRVFCFINSLNLLKNENIIFFITVLKYFSLIKLFS